MGINKIIFLLSFFIASFSDGRKVLIFLMGARSFVSQKRKIMPLVSMVVYGVLIRSFVLGAAA